LQSSSAFLASEAFMLRTSSFATTPSAVPSSPSVSWDCPMVRPDRRQSQQQRAASARGSGAISGVTIQTESKSRRTAMAQKVIDVVGTSKESFAKAAENAVAKAAKTVRGMKRARVAEFEMELDGQKIAQYRTTTKIYFDIEK
jgi:dodecin